jgi:hypothetical protein
MELFELQAATGLSVGKKISPLKFRHVLPEGALEQDLEDLIVAQPSLLHWSDVASFENPDLLIISRQPRHRRPQPAPITPQPRLRGCLSLNSPSEYLS